MNRASRTAALIAIALVVPACNITFTSNDPFGTPNPQQNPFVLQIPVDGSNGVLTIDTEFAWTDYAGAQSYELQISETSDFALILVDQASIMTTSVFIQAGLTNSSIYYWRVFAIGAFPPVLAGGSPFQFATFGPPFAPPLGFLLQSPTGGPVSRTPVFQWMISTGAVSYSLQVDVTSSFSSPLVDLSDIHFNEVACPVSLAPLTTYYWRVVAINPYGQVNSSPPFLTFTTGP